MHKKTLLILFLLTLLTYGNSLFNGFVGDDEVVILNNKFYQDWKHFPQLFNKAKYLTRSKQVYFNVDDDFGSGSVAYRPVLSATYFVDYALWKTDPFGYHLNNLVLHLLNAVLVYFLLFFILGKSDAALLGSLIFSVHPIQTEAVCNVGYRADSLAFFFLLSAFLAFIRYAKHEGTKRYLLYSGSLVFFWLALFSKESAIVFPALILCYDFYIKKMSLAEMVRQAKSRYLGLIVIAIAHVYIYGFVFTNTSLQYVPQVSESFFIHIVKMCRIWVGYIIVLIFPAQVTILPPLYAPDAQPLWAIENIFAVLIVVFLALFTLKRVKHRSIISFFVLWFVISLIPVSGIIPLINPVAYRFIYLPSVGFCAVLAIVLEKITIKRTWSQYFSDWKALLVGTIIGACMLITIIQNRLWHDNYMIAFELIKNYPDQKQGYVILGIEHFKNRLYDQAKPYLIQSLRLGSTDPRVYYRLGVCYMDQSPEAAEVFLKKAIELQNDYAAPYIRLSDFYLRTRAYDRALPYLEKSVILSPHWAGNYVKLIQAYVALKRYDSAKSAFIRAKNELQNPEQLQRLEQFFLSF